MPLDSAGDGVGVGGGVVGAASMPRRYPRRRAVRVPRPRPRLAARPSARYRRGHGRCHRCHVRGRGPPAVLRGPGRGRPVGALVRAVHDPRPDHRAGGGRHRRSGRAGQGQRRREPGDLGRFPGPVDPGRVRRARRGRRRPVHRRPARGGGPGLRRRAGAGPLRGRPAGRGGGRRRRRGHRCAGRSTSSPTTRSPSPPWPRCSSPAGTPTRPWPCSAGIPETPEIRRLLAEARLAVRDDVAGADAGALLDGLLERVKDDPDARQEFLDLLETLGPGRPPDPRLPQGTVLPALLTAGPSSPRPPPPPVASAPVRRHHPATRTPDRSTSTHRALVMGILNRTPDSFYDKGATFALDDLVRRAGRPGRRGRRPARRGRGQGRTRPRGRRGRGARPGGPGHRGPGRPLRHPAVGRHLAGVGGRARPTGPARWWATTSAGSPTPTTCRPRPRRGPRWWPPTSASAPGSPTPSPSTTTWSTPCATFLVERADRARGRRHPPDRIVIDAGLDLGKTAAQSLALLRASDRLADLGYPLLLSASNKTFLGVVLDLEIGHRREASLAAASLGRRPRVPGDAGPRGRGPPPGVRRAGRRRAGAARVTAPTTTVAGQRSRLPGQGLRPVAGGPGRPRPGRAAGGRRRPVDDGRGVRRPGVDQFDVGAVIDACTTPPFLVDRRVVVVREAGQMAAADAKRLVGVPGRPAAHHRAGAGGRRRRRQPGPVQGGRRRRRRWSTPRWGPARPGRSGWPTT